jgi:hypothetical protein
MGASLIDTWQVKGTGVVLQANGIEYRVFPAPSDGPPGRYIACANDRLLGTSRSLLGAQLLCECEVEIGEESPR